MLIDPLAERTTLPDEWFLNLCESSLLFRGKPSKQKTWKRRLKQNPWLQTLHHCAVEINNGVPKRLFGDVHLELCAGYGGIGLGLDTAGVPSDSTLYVEIEGFAVANLISKIRAGLLPPGLIWTDLKTVSGVLSTILKEGGKELTNLKILSGGFP